MKLLLNFKTDWYKLLNDYYECIFILMCRYILQHYFFSKDFCLSIQWSAKEIVLRWKPKINQIDRNFKLYNRLLILGWNIKLNVAKSSVPLLVGQVFFFVFAHYVVFLNFSCLLSQNISWFMLNFIYFFFTYVVA